LKLEFDIQDGNSYKNEYKNYQALYHGSTEYKNLPKVVPVDIDEGFYAFTSTGSGKMVAYGDSSMPSYFIFVMLWEIIKRKQWEGMMIVLV